MRELLPTSDDVWGARHRHGILIGEAVKSYFFCMGATMVKSSKLIILVTTSLLAAPTVTGQIPSKFVGTYALRICSTSCSVNDSSRTLNTGFLVLSNRPIDLSHIPVAARYQIRKMSEDLTWGHRGNACFSLGKQRPPRVMAGIIPHGVTRWTIQHDTVSVLLFRSPDASSSLRATLQDGKLIGVGREAGSFGGSFDNPAGIIQGIRIGPPDVSKCFSDSLIAGYLKNPEPTHDEYKIEAMLDARDRAEASGDSALFKLAYHAYGSVTDENGRTYYGIDSILPAKLKSSANARLHPREIVLMDEPRITADRRIAYIEEYVETIPSGPPRKSSGPLRKTTRVTFAQVLGDRWTILREIIINITE